MSDKFVIEIKKRAWYEWLLWVIWAAVEIFIVQNAFASGRELEPRAETIFWIAFVVIFIFGITIWLMRRHK